MATASNSSETGGPAPPSEITAGAPLVPSAGAAPPAPGRPLRSGLVAWAEREAGIELAAGAPAIRAALVERLERERLESEGRLPSRSVQYAFETLLIGRERLEHMGLEPSAGEYYVAAERALHTQIEALAGEFFQIEPGARAVRWRNLLEKSADFPSPTLRLRRLEAGLDALPPPPDSEPVLESLARHLMEIFALAPHERARLRRFPPERFAEFVPRWPAAAARLRQQYPKLAALELEWIDQLIKIKQLATRGYASPSVLPVDRPAEVSEFALHETDPDDFRRRRRRRIAIVIGQVVGFSAVAIFVAVKMIVGLGLWPPGGTAPHGGSAAGAKPSGWTGERPSGTPSSTVVWPTGSRPFQ